MTEPSDPQTVVDSHPDWSHIPEHAHHVFLCTGPRCTQRGALQLWKKLRRQLLEHQRIEVPGGVLLTRTHCQFPCNLGPVLTVYPQACWYRVSNEAEAIRLVDVHLVGGEIVEDMLIRERR
ncbi:(2Fe-2S) ferredoxin domain-containing protein [Pseudomonas vancouverensis]|uniref:(2Fe-2S) ferredoxin domain-containing protein n=1 Tax=Pseudomonas vancouverensis TaxID=95300 RepID=A0A1H2NPX4_PSEVA|nr:(2Fe-2S) ferredoxin domain-containing protein [Pseudomonas vancouverensis]KAB0491278.1 (2Fe-2S) ferredoxin domain-containing protein [Pseudomonas vancouverensis]TDB64311.1 (2Fe-2S) ferredoxin domain-containing protein [Pseudomonas vancouverensis]SDV07424.1 (2Fe-2S) ferredoxin [Pseudomonas vancouverensis]